MIAVLAGLALAVAVSLAGVGAAAVAGAFLRIALALFRAGRRGYSFSHVVGVAFGSAEVCRGQLIGG